MGLTMEEIAIGIKEKKYKNIAFMVGAGISTGAGIPDFRSPETGLYANLEKLNLPYPEAVFDIDYFKKHPEAFYTLADGLYPGKYSPTKFHKFIKKIQDAGLLKRVYTQNIDTLERLAGVDEKYMIEAHGSFAKNFCIECKHSMSVEEIKEAMWGEDFEKSDKKGKKVGIPRCKNKICKNKKQGGLVKPSIVFFGEQLPKSFFQALEDDLPDEVDLAIVAGTSLTVQPFASLPTMVNCPRILFNDERVGNIGRKRNDVVVIGDCDEKIEEFCKLIGWSLDEEEEEGSNETEETEEEGGGVEAAEEKVEEIAKELEKVELEGDKEDDKHDKKGS